EGETSRPAGVTIGDDLDALDARDLVEQLAKLRGGGTERKTADEKLLTHEPPPDIRNHPSACRCDTPPGTPAPSRPTARCVFTLQAEMSSALGTCGYATLEVANTMTAAKSTTCWRRRGKIIVSSPHIDRVHAHQSLLSGCDRGRNAWEAGLRLFDDLAAVVHDAPAPFGISRARDRDHLHVSALLRVSTDVLVLFVPLDPARSCRAATYARRCITFCLRQLRQAARMLATLSAPISLGNTSLRRDDGTPVIRAMQSAHRPALPMLSSISVASRFSKALSRTGKTLRPSHRSLDAHGWRQPGKAEVAALISVPRSEHCRVRQAGRERGARDERARAEEVTLDARCDEKGEGVAFYRRDSRKGGFMKGYNAVGYTIILAYAVACVYFAPPHIGPWAGLMIGAAYFVICWFVGGLYLSPVMHMGIAHRALDYKEWFVKTITV